MCIIIHFTLTKISFLPYNFLFQTYLYRICDSQYQLTPLPCMLLVNLVNPHQLYSQFQKKSIS